MKKNLFFKLFLVFIFGINLNPIYSQYLRKIVRLPEIVEETSGVEVNGDNEIWTFNDSGGKPVVYVCDTLGNLVGSILFKGVKNRDWEEIAKDNKGNMYIGDFGNNKNKRKILSIFKVDIHKGIIDTSIEPGIITFNFEDQFSFPPPSDRLNFDCESMFWYNDYIYLFTKHRTFPMSTNLYRIPDSVGHYKAKKIGTFFTGGEDEDDHERYDYWITAADISPDLKKIVLLSGNKLWLFYDFLDDAFFDGKVKQINLGSSTQKEGICFRNNNELYITDEYWKQSNIGRNLYLLKLNNVLNKTRDKVIKVFDIQLYPNPAINNFYVEFNKTSNFNATITLYDISGKEVFSNMKEKNENKIKMNIDDIIEGLYFMKIKYKDIVVFKKIIVFK